MPRGPALTKHAPQSDIADRISSRHWESRVPHPTFPFYFLEARRDRAEGHVITASPTVASNAGS